MRRKVIQDFANVFCQRFVDLPSGYDLATFAYLGSGTVVLDVLTGECSFNGVAIRQLHTCEEDRAWLGEQCHKHNIPLDGIIRAAMTIVVDVTDVVVKRTHRHTFRSACFTFDCQSEIATNEKLYRGRAAGQKVWGFCWYWEQLYGETNQP